MKITFLKKDSCKLVKIFDFHYIDNDTFLIQNHLLHLLKLHIYNARKYRFLFSKNFQNEISKIKNLERTIEKKIVHNRF